MLGKSRVLAVVTARAGSQGVPGKNYRPLMGLPLYLWSVKAAIDSLYVDEVVVSSNCPGCREAYDKYLLGFPWLRWLQRPDELATATSKNEEALIHAVGVMREQGFDPDIVVNLQPTSPCRVDNLLDRCLEAYEKGGHDSLLTGARITPFMWRKQDGKWVYEVDKNGCCNRKMRQDFIHTENESEFLWHDCGSVYIVSTDVLLKTSCRIGNSPCVFEVDELNGLQIDSEFDFLLIEQLLEAKKLSSPV